MKVNGKQKKKRQTLGSLWDRDFRLGFAKGVLDSDDNWLNKVETEFVQASIIQRRWNIAWLWIVSGLIVFLAFAIAAYYWYQLQLSQLREKAARAGNLLSTNPVGSLVTAIEAIGHNRRNFILDRNILPEVQSSIIAAVQVSKERNVLDKHTIPVFSTAISPDGQMIVTGDQNGIIWQWDREGNPIGQFPHQDQGFIETIAFSPDGQTIVTAGQGSQVRLWNREGKLIGSVTGESEQDVTSVAFSPNGQLIVGGGVDGTVWLWDRNGKLIGQPFRGSQVTSVAFSRNGRYIAVGSADQKVRFWDLTGKRIGKDLPGDKVAFSPNGSYIVTGGNDGRVQLCQLKSKPSCQLFLGHRKDVAVTSVAFTPDGQTIVSGSNDDTVRFWDLKGNPIGEPLRGYWGGINSIAISPDGTYIVTAAGDTKVRLWDLGTQDNLVGKALSGHQEAVNSVAFSPDGQYLVSGSDDKTVRLWNLKRQSIERPYKKHQEAVNSVTFSPDSQYIASGSNDKTVRLWNLKNNWDCKLSNESEDFDSIVFSPDGKYLVSANNDKKRKSSTGSVNLWNLSLCSSSNPIGSSLSLPKENSINSFRSVAVSKQHIVAGSEYIDSSGNSRTGGIWIWSLQEQIKTGSQELKSDDSDTNSSNQATPRVFQSNPELRVTMSVAFSPDEKIIASGSEDGTIRLWNLEGNLIAQPFQAHQKAVNSLAFSQDGQTLISGSTDGSVFLWELNENKLGKFLHKNLGLWNFNENRIGNYLHEKMDLWNLEVHRIGQLLQGHTASINSVSFSKNGEYIASGGNDNKVWLWRNVNWKTALQVGCNRLLNNPVFKNPDTPETRGAKETCKKYVWNTQTGIEASIAGKISKGNKILLPTLINPDKQTGVRAIATGNFTTAIKHLQASLKRNNNDPEARIYLNNARIGSQESNTIAVSVPLNDLNSALEILRGVAQAQELYNKWVRESQRNELPLKVLIADDRNDPEVAKAIAKQLADNPDVLGVVGHFSSNVTREAAKIYNDRKLVAISPVSTSVELSNDVLGRYVFRTVPTDKVAAGSLAEYMLGTLNKTKAIVFYNSQSEYSKSLSSEFQSFVTSKNGQVTLIDLSNSDFVAEQVVESSIQQGAEVLVLMPNIEELDKAFQVVETNDGRLPLLAGDDVYGPTILEKAGKQANGMVIAIPWHIGANINTEFSNIATRLWKGDVNWRTAMAYDAAKALIAAIKKEPTREGVSRMIRSEDFTADGSTKNVAFLPSGDRKESKIQLVKIVKSKSKFCSVYDYTFIPEPLLQNNNQSSPCY